MKEVDIHNLMRHKNVVRLEAHFQRDSKFYMVLEHCEMNNMAQLLKARKRFTENESKNYLRQLLAGLQHIHERGIIHRDLKPANIYLTQDMVLKIGDFGLADRVQCKSRGICGTPNYISPEVLNERGYTTAVDIWATGCITYHMITGRPPFEADNQAATYDLIRSHRYPEISPRQAGPALRHLIHWMLAFRPEDRPSIPFIFAHAWMKRGCRRDRVRQPNPKLCFPRFRSREKSPKAVAPENDDFLRNRICRASLESVGTDENNKKDSSFWKSILEKAKSGKKILSCEDASGKPPLRHFKTKLHANTNWKMGEAIKAVLEEVLRGIPQQALPSDGSEDFDLPVFVSKWIDYSNKYGFGYQLTDGSFGVFFNDGTHLCVDGDNTFMTLQSKCHAAEFSVDSVPEHLREKAAILNYFVEYMDANLSSGVSDLCKRTEATGSATFIRRWTRNDKVIFFEMTDGLVQVNFFRDHRKLVLYEAFEKNQKQIILVVADGENNITTYNLTKMGSSGCPENIIMHLMYIHELLV